MVLDHRQKNSPQSNFSKNNSQNNQKWINAYKYGEIIIPYECLDKL